LAAFAAIIAIIARLITIIIAPLFDIAIFDYPTDPLTPIRHAIIAITPLRLLRAG
jgi:hypothetical protein